MRRMLAISFLIFAFSGLSAIQDQYDNFDINEVISGRNILGRLIYAVDLYGINATEYIAKKGIVQSDKRIKGWVVLLDDITKTRVIFYGFQGIALQGLHQVTFNKDTVSYEDISKKEISAEDIAMIKARETVLNGFKPLCSVKYDAVILERKERIAVYMIPASADPDMLSLAGPQVFYTDKKGMNIVEYRTFNETCESYPLKDNKGKRLTEIEITLKIDKIPTEILVYQSVLKNIPLKVISSDKKEWRIEKGVIIKKEEKKGAEKK